LASDVQPNQEQTSGRFPKNSSRRLFPSLHLDRSLSTSVPPSLISTLLFRPNATLRIRHFQRLFSQTAMEIIPIAQSTCVFRVLDSNSGAFGRPRASDWSAWFRDSSNKPTGNVGIRPKQLDGWHMGARSSASHWVIFSRLESEASVNHHGYTARCDLMPKVHSTPSTLMYAENLP
jgi:hypothetical protein